MGFLRSLFDGEYGLARASVSQYFGARQKGYDHAAALQWMVESRYRDVADTKQRVRARASEVLGSGSWDDHLRIVIGMMYTLELGLAADYHAQKRRDAMIDEVLAEFKQRFPQLP